MTATPRPDRRVTRLDQIAAHVALSTGALFALLLLALHIVEPEFDPTWRFVSEYALGHAGWLMPVAFTALAATLLSAALSVVRHVRTLPGLLGVAVILVAAAGLLIAAAFTTDPMTTPAHAATTSGRLHVLGASLDYSPIGMLLTGWSLTRTSGWQHRRRALTLAAGVCLALMLAFMASLPFDGHFGPDVHAGLVGRFLLLSYLGWTTLTAKAVLDTATRPMQAAAGMHRPHHQSVTP